MKKLNFIILIAAIAISVNCHAQNIVDFESLGLGTNYGNGINEIGEIIFTEDGIDVAVEYFFWEPGTGTFGSSFVDQAMLGFGSGQTMATNNINLEFNFVDLGMNVTRVTIEYLDMGGLQNLQVNGSQIFIGYVSSDPIPTIHPTIEDIEVDTIHVGGGIRGFITITAVIGSTIDSLMIGGQEFWLDNITTDDITNINSNINSAVLSEIMVYPNPAKQELNISVEGYEIDDVTIYTLAGQQILQERPANGTIDISHLKPGMFIVEVAIENVRLRQKLLVQK